MAAVMRVMELHAPVQTVQRSQGRSATAAAAYRTASRIECERTGQVHDYTRKRGVEATAMLVPDKAPDWAMDRTQLWNQAEAREKRKDAQTAREVHVAFPSEFTPEQRRKAGLQIGLWIVGRYGAAVDLAWHEPSKDGDERNHHMHAMFTVRRLEEKGFAAKKDNPLDSPKTSAEELKAMRGAFAGVLNDISARESLGVYVEHVSFKKRGLDREATKHLGPNAAEMEKRGVKTDRGNENREILKRNAEREKLHQDKKIVDIEVERQRLEAKRQALQITAGRKEEQSPAPDDDAAMTRESVNPVMGFHPAAWVPFYADVEIRRRKMLEDQDREHGGREEELKKQMVALHQRMDGRNIFVRFWRHATGKTKADTIELQRATEDFDAIQEKKRLQNVAFEQDRQRRMEELREQFEAKRAISAEAMEAMRVQEAQALNERVIAEQLETDALQRVTIAQEATEAAPPVHAPSPEPIEPQPAQDASQFNSASSGVEAAGNAADRFDRNRSSGDRFERNQSTGDRFERGGDLFERADRGPNRD